MKEQTFKNYYLGRSNTAAYDFLLASILFPGHVMNPLYIYGDSGVGKTHLLRAVQDTPNHLIPARRTVYTTARELCDELVKSIQAGEICRMFENRFRDADIVMIDDVQYIAKKNATQAEIAGILVALCDRNQQVILACDRPLEEFPILYLRMRTRSKSLKKVRIHLPDRTLRKKLIWKKAEALGLTISNETASDILKKSYTSLAIDGALNELKLRSDMNGGCLTMKRMTE